MSTAAAGKSLREVSEELAVKSAALAEYFEKHKAEDGALKMGPEECAEARKRNDELTDLGEARDELKSLQLIQEQTAALVADLAKPNRPNFGGGVAPGGGGAVAPIKSWGDQAVESSAYKSLVRDGVIDRSGPFTAGMDIAGSLKDWMHGVKAPFDTAGSSFTQYDRQPGIILLGLQKVTVADLLAQGQTTMNTIRYAQEDTLTNTVAAVTEGAAKPEQVWDTSEADSAVRKIAAYSKFSEELLADFPAFRDYVNARMPLLLRITEEAELLSGSGTPPHLKGILSYAIQSQATSTDTNPDAIYKAIVKVRTVGFFEPDAVVIHPNNWTPIRLLKTTTGEYVWGHPAEPGPERIWGLMVDVTTGITANTGLVGAFKLGAQVFYREGVRLEMTNTDQDDFIKNLVTIRVEQREALAVYRLPAFCKVTGLNT